MSIENLTSLREKKSSIIKNAINSIKLNGLDPTLGKILNPSKEDLLLIKLIEKEIKEYVSNKNKDILASEDFALSKLHLYLKTDYVEDCVKSVTNTLQKDLLIWAKKYCQERLGFVGDFFIDKEVYVRINFPYKTAVKGKRSAITHPDHRLTSYNLGLPKAAWAHGPHKDSWYGHSHTAINFWMSVCGTNRNSTMVLFPEKAYVETDFNPSTMYAEYSENIGKPLEFELEKGQNFLFDPELLHSTRLNTSNSTRIVITVRVSQDTPLFSKDIAHDVYDKWIPTSNIDNRDFLYVNVGKRIIDPTSVKTKGDNQSIKVIKFPFKFQTLNTSNPDIPFLEEFIKYKLIFSDKTLIAYKVNETIYLIPTLCPHVKAPLEYGFFSESDLTLTCPAHGVKYKLNNGKSNCNMLNLKIHKLTQRKKN